MSLPHHHGKSAAKIVGSLPRHMAQHAGGAPSGRNDAGKEFEKRRFPSAVGPKQGHKLTSSYGQIDAPQGRHQPTRAAKQARYAGQ